MSTREYPINEFKDLAEKNCWEVYSLEQVRDFASDVVKSIDPTEQEHGAIDFVSLNRVVVVDENFNKSVVYYREPQIEWKDADTETIEKAGMTGLPVKNKIGFYKDTPEMYQKIPICHGNRLLPRIYEYRLSLSDLLLNVLYFVSQKDFFFFG